MSFDLLTTSGINKFVSNYSANEQTKRLGPHKAKKAAFENLNTAYSSLTTQINSLKTILKELKEVGGAAFNAKATSTSGSTFASITATASANVSTNSLRINQLAKSDLVLSKDLISADFSAAITSPGTHKFTIVSGDGSGGQVNSTVSVSFVDTDFTDGTITNKKVMEKIQNAINVDKAVINSNSVTGTNSAVGSFKLNLNGKETEITYSEGSYSDVLDSVVAQIKKISGVTATKELDGESYKLKITVTDASKYISINGDTGSLVADLNIGVNKEKGASGVLSASAFSPESLRSQLSLTAKASGYDNRILSLLDDSGSNVLDSVGLNLGSTRTLFEQSSGEDTAGYVNALSTLNAKFEFNGIRIERNSNSISDLISGATISLKSVMKDSDSNVSLAISNDTAAVKQKIQSFIDKFNDVFNYIKNNSTTTSGKRGALVGDATSSSLTRMFGSVANSNVAGISTNDLNSLPKIGISFNSNSGLSLSDSSLLESAIINNSDQLQAVFNSTDGIATKLFDGINPYIAVNGYLSKSKDSFSKSIKSINDRIDFETVRIEKNGEAMRRRYQKMQAQMATLLSNQSKYTFTSNNNYF